MGVCQQSQHSTGYGHTAFAAWAMLTLTIGCSDSPENAVEVTPVARRQPASLTAPLTPADIRICLNVAAEMPEGKLPEFVPVGQSIIDDRMSAKQLIEAYRTEYRRMFDPVEQARHWRSDEQLVQILTEQGTTPEEFASLLTRVGCGIAAHTMKSKLNLDEASAKASEQLAEIVLKMDAMDQQKANPRVSPVAIAQRRQPLVDQLKSLVALSEFSAVLSSVPPQTTDVISQHWEALASLLPAGGELDMFERTLDAPAVIVPASHERPDAR
ncbi:MAG: hypothetical protein KDA86_04800 [Planctomycetaceae bacterium]|nr:hypothetical protein [Planctomycetaceae bacterium]MCA9108881.1 hypothetical protein [Planctomycetaceae bacterium]